MGFGRLGIAPRWPASLQDDLAPMATTMSPFGASARGAHVCDLAVTPTADFTVEATTVCHLEAGVTHPPRPIVANSMRVSGISQPMLITSVADPALTGAIAHPISIVSIAIVPIAIVPVTMAAIAVTRIRLFIAIANRLFIAVTNDWRIAVAVSWAVAITRSIAITVDVVTATSIAVVIPTIVAAVSRGGYRGADQRASGKP